MVFQERLEKLKSNWKEESLDILIALVLTTGIYFLYQYLEISGFELFVPIVFLFILIYLKIPRRQIW